MKKILLAVTGSIAAYKSLEIVRLLIKKNCQVKVILTKSAVDFVTPLSFHALTGDMPYTALYDETDPMPHITLAKWADAILVAPATTSKIADIVSGTGYDLLTATILASEAELYIAPAMNKNMWLNKANQSNVETLLKRGVNIIGPICGLQACGDDGVGAVESPDKIVDEILPKKTKGKIVITAGPTREPVDPVRYISNYSSGKMGYAIAQAFSDSGYEVCLVSGPTNMAKPYVDKIIEVVTADQMHQAVMSNMQDAKLFIASAAVCDYRVKKYSDKKIKKPNMTNIEMVENVDILSEVGHLQTKPYVVGFAMETDDHLDNAKKKLLKKKADLIILNKLNAENPLFGEDQNIVTFITEDDVMPLPQQTKKDIAKYLVEFYESKIKK